MHADEPTSATSSTRRLVLLCAAVIVVTTTAVAIAIGTHSAADRDWNPPSADEATLLYEVHDDEVAPELQRNFRLTLSKGAARLAIYSYDLVLFDETFDLPDDVWQRTLDAAAEFHGVLSTPKDGCAGAESNELAVIDEENKAVVYVFVDGCTQGDVPDTSGVIEEVRRLLDVDRRLASVDYTAPADAGD